jgi:hypothetical protein
VNSIAQILELHERGGRRLAECLFLELAGVDLDINAEQTIEAIDTALRGMSDAVIQFNQRLGVTDEQTNAEMTDAAVGSFLDRWHLLCSGSGGTA